MSDNKKEITSQEPQKVGGVGQVIKFALFSMSAGIIQVASFTFMNEVLIKLPFIQNAIESNETFGNIMTNKYGPIYLIALLLSVIWNFTFNRKFTFKSAANVPVAMFKVLIFYAMFTPVSTIAGNYFTARFADVAIIEYLVLGITMLFNLTLEFLWDKFIVFRGQEGTAKQKNKE